MKINQVRTVITLSESNDRPNAVTEKVFLSIDFLTTYADIVINQRPVDEIMQTLARIAEEIKEVSPSEGPHICYYYEISNAGLTLGITFYNIPDGTQHSYVQLLLDLAQEADHFLRRMKFPD